MPLLNPELQEEELDVSPVDAPIDAEYLKKRHLEFEREALPHMDALYNFALRMT